MQFVVAVTKLSCQNDDFCQDEFGDGARIRERRIKDADPVLGSVAKVDLVGADAEAADDDQIFGMGENAGGQLGL